jgi:hypothetical protein
MGISWGLKRSGLRVFLDGGRPGWQACLLVPILLTSLRHVNRSTPEIVARRTQNGAIGSFLSNADALELTVPHKTVAEPH